MRKEFKRILLILLVLSLGLNLSCTQGKKEKLEVTFLDIGQGDSAFISTPGGKNILIDGGKRAIPPYSKFDAGKEVILPFLKNKGVKKIDTLIATHPDGDHIGGLLAILDSDIQIDKVLDSGYKHTSYTYRDFLKKIGQRKETKYYQPRAGQVLNWGDEVSVQVLSPAHLFRDSNNCSIVIKLEFGDISFLLTGDAEKEAEGEMVSRYSNKLKSTVLKASHHGSRTGSSLNFLKAVKPQVAVISCGRKNKFGLPHKEVMDKLARFKAKVYRTDYQGNITFTTNGKKLWIGTEK
ncbi:DNA internalization-related competence protein ComEC/Rec2 [bacterium]|nr:DNA internalization-related competence protein ComEC/Rec2 [bacterium]